MAVEVGSAYVSIIPSFKGFASAIQSEVAKHLPTIRDGLGGAGEEGGRRMSNGVSGALSSLSFSGVIKQAAGFAAVLGAGGVAGAAVHMGITTAASLEQAQIGFATLLGSGDKAKTFLADLSKFAAATPFELPGLIDSSRTLLGVGVSADKIIPTLTAFGDAAGAVGVGQEAFQRIMLATSQAVSAGTFKIEDLNQISENGIPVWKILSEAMGKPVPQLRDLATKGKLLTSDVLPLLNSQMEKDYGGAMARQSQTLTGVWSTLMDSLNIGLAQTLQPLVPMLKDAIPQAASFLSDTLGTVGNVIKVVIGTVTGKGADVPGSPPWLNPVINAVGTVMDLFDKTKGAISALIAAFKAGGNDVTSAGVAGAMERVGLIARQVWDWIDKTGIPAIKRLASFLGPLLADAFNATVTAVSFVLDVLHGVFDFIKNNTTVILSVAAGLGVLALGWAALQVPIWLTMAAIKAWQIQARIVSAVTKAWTAVQAVFNAVMSANPLALVVIAVVALVAAFVIAYKRSEKFRDIVHGVLHAVADAGKWMWNSVLKPVWEALKSAWDATASAFEAAWTKVLKPAIDGIAFAAKWLWETVLKPVFGFIVAYWKFIFTAMLWAWNNILKPVFTAVAAVVWWVWDTIIKVAFWAIKQYWELILTAMQWAWDNVLKPVWNALSAAAQWLWNTVLKPIFGYIQAGWGLVLAAMQWAWNNVLKPVWDALTAAAQWLWNSVLKPVFGFIQAYWAAILAAMQWAWDNLLKPAWNAVSSAASWLWGVLKGVFDGIKGAWQSAVDGISWVWNNVLKPVFDTVKSVISGAGDKVGKAFDAIPSAFSSAFSSAKNAIRDGWNAIAGWVNRNVIAKINGTFHIGISDVPTFATGGPVNARGANAPRAYADGGAIRGPGTGTSDSILARLSNGEFVINARSANAIGPALLHWLNSLGSSAGVTAAQLSLLLPRFRTGGPADGGGVGGFLGGLWDGAKRGASTSWGWLKDHTIGEVRDALRNALGGLSRVIPDMGFMSDVFRNMITKAMDLLVFDNGGWLMPGEVAVNRSGRPEPVFNDAQWKVLSSAAAGGGGGSGTTINVYPLKADFTVRDLEAVQARQDALARVRRAR